MRSAIVERAVISPVRDFPRDYLGCRVVFGGLAIPLIVAGSILVTVAVTWQGRFAGVGAVAIGVSPWLICTALAKRTRGWRVAATGATMVAVCSLVAGVGASLGFKLPAERVSRVFERERKQARAFAPTRLVPEVDQLRCAFTLMPMIDPLFTLEQAAQLKAMTAHIYAEANREDDFGTLDSALDDTYADLLGWSRTANAYLYLPRGLDRRRPQGAIVFFHGSGGNFKGYLWVLSRVADQLGVVLVAPSGGLGRWPEEETAAAFDFALKAVEDAVTLDRQRVTVIGLSNGGLAVSRLVAARTDRFGAAVLLSPVLDDAAVAQGSLRNKNVLVLTGDRDDRVPLEYVTARVATLRRTAANVDLRTLPADHFLIFSHYRETAALLTEWLATHGERPSSNRHDSRD